MNANTRDVAYLKSMLEGIPSKGLLSDWRNLHKCLPEVMQEKEKNEKIKYRDLYKKLENENIKIILHSIRVETRSYGLVYKIIYEVIMARLEACIPNDTSTQLDVTETLVQVKKKLDFYMRTEAIADILAPPLEACIPNDTSTQLAVIKTLVQFEKKLDFYMRTDAIADILAPPLDAEDVDGLGG